MKTYNNSNTKQLDVWLVKLRCKDKVARCRFFIVPGDGPALLGTTDIELLGIVKITYEVVEDQ